MQTYVIERNIPGVQDLQGKALADAAATSNAALAKLGPAKVQWVESYVVEDKTFCIYRAEDEQAVLDHARLSGFPANTISEVKRTIDPTTANL